jgi:hypothetical protein
LESRQDRGNVPEKKIHRVCFFLYIGIKLSASYSLIRLVLHVIHKAILSHPSFGDSPRTRRRPTTWGPAHCSGPGLEFLSNYLVFLQKEIMKLFLLFEVLVLTVQTHLNAQAEYRAVCVLQQRQSS